VFIGNDYSPFPRDTGIPINQPVSWDEKNRVVFMALLLRRFILIADEPGCGALGNLLFPSCSILPCPSLGSLGLQGLPSGYLT